MSSAARTARTNASPTHQAHPRYHEQILNAARAAIIRGEKPRPVVERLRQMGVNPSSVMREHGILTQDEIDGRRAAWIKIFFLLVFALCVVFVATWLPSLQKPSKPVAGTTPVAPPAAIASPTWASRPDVSAEDKASVLAHARRELSARHVGATGLPGAG